jgi:pimeloyl-ACP methyl ester carboxylesterase
MTEFISEGMSFVTRSLSWALGIPSLHIEDRLVTISTGLTTPLRIHGNQSPNGREHWICNGTTNNPLTVFTLLPFPLSYKAIIFGHGLGSRNPRNKTHLTDDWAATLRDAKLLVPDSTLITYTARGHGDSRGWETTAESNPAQFTWENLADDMVAIADSLQYDQFIAAGSSMGG